MKKYSLIILSFAVGFLYSCSIKPKTNFTDIKEVEDSFFVISDTIITQINESFINISSNQEVSVLHHLDETELHTYNSVKFKTKNIGILVGGQGLRTRITTNGGETWLEKKFSDWGNTFHSVAFSENSIFVVGESKYIYRTSDYGENWSIFNPEPIVEGKSLYGSYHKIRFITKKIGFIVGKGIPDAFSTVRSPVILKTIDGGENWTSIEYKNIHKNTEAITDFVAFSEKEIMIVTSSGHYYKSTDGGIHWKLLYDTKDEFISLNSIAFLNPEIGLIGGTDGHLMYTDNGGENWLEIDIPRSPHDWDKPNCSAIIFLKNTALITTEIRSEYFKSKFVFKIDKNGTNIRPFLTSQNENVNFIGESFGIEVLNNEAYILDKDNLYKTSIIDK